MVLVVLVCSALPVLLPLGACSKQSEEVPAITAESNLIPFRKGGSWGFSDAKKTLIIKPDYDSAEPFSEGLAKVGRGHSGFVDKTGKLLIPLEYDNAFSFSDGLALVCKDAPSRLCGFIDQSGKEIIPLKYEEARPFVEGLAAVKQKKKWGFIDKTGKEMIPLKYEGADSFSDDLALVILNNKYGFIDKNGKVSIPFKYDGGRSFSENTATVARRLITRTGPNSTFVEIQWGFIDKDGKELIPFGKYNEAHPFHEGLAGVILVDKSTNINSLGYIDKDGKEVIPFKYSFRMIPINQIYNEAVFGDFSEGLVQVCLNKKWGYIDKSGQEIIPFKYDEAEAFSKDLGKVKLGGNVGYVGRDGTEYFEP